MLLSSYDMPIGCFGRRLLELFAAAEGLLLASVSVAYLYGLQQNDGGLMPKPNYTTSPYETDLIRCHCNA